jgi:hypothetical protein
MNIRGDSMKGLFIMFIMFSLFISGCELIEEEGPQMSWPEEGGESMQLPIPNKIGGGAIPTASLCESTFVGGLCMDTGLDIYAVCSLKPKLECGLGDQCAGPFNGLVDICGGDYSGYGWGDCYCVGDGECHTEFGEPTTSIDCQDCTSGDTQSCNLPSDPGTCGECNEGLKTCTNGQWGTCEQVTFPVQEDCNNALDDDCDCNPDYSDSDCLTHLECNENYECVEFPGEGSNVCEGNVDCVEPTHLECNGDLECVEVSGTGSNQCNVNLNCESYCGDNDIDTPNGQGFYEVCDGSDLGELSDCSMIDGFEGGYIECLSDCSDWDTSNCVEEGAEVVCGDGICSEGEFCIQDRFSCPDNPCYEPTCTNGCTEAALPGHIFFGLPYEWQDESCSGDFMCDGEGNCVEKFCDLTSVYWRNPFNNYHRVAGDEISLVVTGSIGCVGEEVTFEVMEDDVYGDDPVNVEPQSAVFELVDSLYVTYAIAVSHWETEYQDDGGAGNPEYYFNAASALAPDQVAQSTNELEVRNNFPSCNAGSGNSCISDVVDNPRIAWFTTGEDSCQMTHGRACIEVQIDKDISIWDGHIYTNWHRIGNCDQQYAELLNYEVVYGPGYNVRAICDDG